MTDKCARCKMNKTKGDIWMSSTEDIHSTHLADLNLPFGKEIMLYPINEEINWPIDSELLKEEFYTLKICNRCRNEWLVAIKDWFFKG